MRAIAWLGTLFGIAALSSSVLAATPADLSMQRWPNASTTFAQPIAVRAPNDGSGRTFVIERCSGIRIVKNGAVLATPFLSVSSSCGSEQGILGLAFDPDFATNGTFYVSYSAPSGDPRLGSSPDHVLARYTVSPPGGDVASPTGTVILRVPDIAGNHNGGDLHFGHDDYLYWSVGDGGAQGDPNGFAQCTGRKKANSNPATCYDNSGSGPTYYLMGKIIRLDVHNTTASAPANFCGATPGQPAQYAIPPGNPFADVAQHPNDCAEVFNWGLRNPFRFSFDRTTGDMLIGDVGQGQHEEISFQAAGSVGQNFQWNKCEGSHTYPGGAPGCTGPAGSVSPKIDYTHAGGNCSVTGGYRYRGPITSLKGQYVFSDYCGGKIYIAANPDPSLSVWSFETMPGTPSLSSYSFGEDALGNLYLTDGGGKIYQFQGNTAPTHVVTPSAGTGGNIAPSTPQTVNEGATTSFVVTPDSGFHISAVTGCGGTLSGTTYTTGPITANCTVTALFAGNPTFVVTPVAGAGGSIAPGTPQTVNQGATTSFTLTANSGFHIDTVSGCGGALAGSTYTTGAITANCTVTAAFAANPTYVVTPDAGPGGSLSPDQPQIVNPGETVEFTVATDPGHSVDEVTGCGGTLIGITYTTGPINANCTVTASFIFSDTIFENGFED